MATAIYLQYNVKLLQFGGLYKVRHPIIILWKLLCSISLSFFMLSSLVDILNNRHLGFNELAINYVNVGIGTLVFLRSHYFFLHQDKSEQLVENMNKIFIYSTKIGFKEKSMSEYVSMTEKITLSFLIGSLFFGESFAIAHLILGDFKNRKLPYPMWYPYDWKSSPMYEITCAQQLICHLLLIILECGVDTFYASSLLLTVGQIELLGWEFQNVMYSALLDCGMDKERVSNFQRQFINIAKHECKKLTLQPAIYDDVYQIIDTDLFDNCLINKFKNLVRFHQELKTYCADLEDFFSPLMLVFTLVFTMITLFSLYFMVNIEDNSIRIIFGGYIILIPVVVFLTCFVGQLLTSQSEHLRNDIYGIPWYLCSEGFKSNFKIVLIGVKEPVVLTIGKFANLSLSISLWILRTGFSYTAVLLQMTG